jgi:cytidylate kinase
MSESKRANIYPNDLIITMDGPAGAGKSTVARMLSQELGYSLLDTGALYRATALHLVREGVNPDSNEIPASALSSMELRVDLTLSGMRLFLGPEEVTDTIRDERVASTASKFSARPEVRRVLLSIQREVAGGGRIVAEGRDMGTVVFPDAPVKFFITADLKERSRRRYEELLGYGLEIELQQVEQDMRIRDHRDATRSDAPLVCPPGAKTIDTTSRSPAEIVNTMIDHIRKIQRDLHDKQNDSIERARIPHREVGRK